jgi:hypothetical protein
VIRVRQFVASAAAGLLAVAGLTGCTSGAQTEEPGAGASVASVSDALEVAQDRGFDWEVSITDDGEISPSDYEQAYDRYMQCQNDLGYVFDKPKYLDPVEGQRWQALSIYRGLGNAPMDDIALCEERISLIETPFVLSTPKRMDPQLLGKFRECLDEKGVVYTGEEDNFNDFTTELGDDEYQSDTSPYGACLLESAFALFPDLISVGFGR